MVVLWSPAIKNGADMKPKRGFGGRIYFYNEKDEAVAVEGQLIVYGYDDSKPRGHTAVPDRRFAFTPNQFTDHFSPTDLGSSYSVWVDWDVVGGPQTDVTLVPIFTSAKGQIVMGQSSRNLLPGPNTQPMQSQVQQQTQGPVIQDQRGQMGGVQQASFQESYPAGLTPTRGYPQSPPMTQPTPSMAPTMPAPEPRGGMQTMSITLPNTLAQRLVNSRPVPQPENNSATAPQMMLVMPQQAIAATGQAPVAVDANRANAFNAPTNDSRSWGPVVPRRGALPLGPPVHYAPGPPQAPAAPGLQSFAGPPPMQPLPVAPTSGHPAWPQSAPPTQPPAGVPAGVGTSR
jgi:hypothetical protein